MEINWNNVRLINNSRNDGFEELVCQLAAREKIEGQKLFRRIGKPDAGKEAYWEFENGKLQMWQAKYFTTSLTASQWCQIEESVMKAIDHHPNLEKYYVCVPLDLPDPKRTGKKSALDKWAEKSKAWQSYAREKGLCVEFIYWGSFELISRISNPANVGFRYFWFNQEEFLDDWFEEKNRSSVSALGARYTEELNLDLPIAKVFDGLSRDTAFELQIHAYYKEFLDKFRRIHILIELEEITTQLSTLSKLIEELRALYEPTHFVGNDPIPLQPIVDLITKCLDVCSRINSALYSLREVEEKENGRKDYYSRPYSSEIGELDAFASSGHSLIRFLRSATCQLANRPLLLITGNAGMGKSHLFADVIKTRKSKQQLSLLLLGEDFTTESHPWTQILSNILRKSHLDEFGFLDALNSKAESEQSRIIIFIDALNEGNGRKIWPRRLKSFIQTIEKYPWVGLVISIRSSFLKLIAPKEDVPFELIARVNHEGFSSLEYRAIKHFFQHYNIVQPTTPLLDPEFRNPLFLKLFCLSLAERNINEVPQGYDGITTIINYFLDSKNIKLSRPEHLHFDDRLPLVQNTVKMVLSKMVESDSDNVSYVEADVIVNSVFKNACSNREPYLQRLISEGVFNDDLHWNDKGEPIDVIYFAYQRFQDHLTVSMLLDQHLDTTHPELSFCSGKLHELIKDKRAAYSNQNLVEALSIQVPERTGKELFEVAPHARMFHSIAEGFIQSLMWRRAETINEKSRDYVNQVVLRRRHLTSQFFDVTILSSLKPGFYFNAERLHAFLMNLSQVKRDQFWTVWIHDKYHRDYEDQSSVRRLIDWAWINERQDHVHDKSMLLGCTAISWFFTSSNRYLRDAATKALVCLLQQRLHLIVPLLKKFHGANDPYVLERIYAACYGAVLRTGKSDQLKFISEAVYLEIFNQETIYPHILLRDYARNIIEFAVYHQCNPELDINKVRPPYKSTPFPKKFPTNAEIDRKYEPKGKSGNYGEDGWGATAILRSMTTEYGRKNRMYGDFGRYTFQRAFDHWKVDHNGLSNYAIKRIFELGYDPKIFTEFDLEQGSGRNTGHKERIGKKYQWIVFYELLARVSDHYDLNDESDRARGSRKTIPFDGPWYPYVRDIDPSIITKETLAERYSDTPTTSWRFSVHNQPWHQRKEEWIIDTKSVPAPEQLLEVKDEAGDSWLWLEMHPEWGEEEALGEDRYQSSQRRLWMQIRSYLVKDDLQKLKSFFSADYHRGELPEARSSYTIFDKEYYWSPAFSFFNKPYYNGEEWVSVYRKGTDRQPLVKLYRTTEFFNWEEEYDCSKNSAIQFYKPANKIWSGLNLNFSNHEGELIDQHGVTVCLDPSVRHNSVSGLLVRKKELIEWLTREKLTLVWGIVGEKQILVFSQEGNVG